MMHFFDESFAVVAREQICVRNRPCAIDACDAFEVDDLGVVRVQYFLALRIYARLAQNVTV